MATVSSATEIVAAIQQGERSPVDVVDQCLARIREHDSELNSFITVFEEQAREQALEAERALETGKAVGALHGVPVAIKDAYAYKSGTKTTFGSPGMPDFVPSESAPLVERLEQAGAIIVGKTNTPEFASKGVTDNGLIGRTKNPFDPAYSPNGSSGGSAAAVAAGLVPLAQGSDHAGSIRAPASACGLVGFFPTPGRVPQAFRPDAYKYTLPYASSGPLARTVEDAALFLDVVAGPHDREPFTLPDTVDFVEATRSSIDGLAVAYSPTLGGFEVDSEVQAVVAEAVEALGGAGADIEERSPAVADWDAAYASLMTGLKVVFASFAEDLKQTAGIDLLARDDMIDPHVINRIRAGQTVTAVEYKRANVARTAVFDAFQSLFEEYELLVTPTVAVPPFTAADGPQTEINGKPLARPHDLALTWPINLTGHPAVSVPAGVVDGLPVGVQFIGRRFDDKTVLAAAARLEATAPWADQYPYN